MRRPYSEELRSVMEPHSRETKFQGERVTLRFGNTLISPALNVDGARLSKEAVSLLFADQTFRWVEMPVGWQAWSDERLQRALPNCRIARD